jgi:Asp/Glu/hydantoin racemase
MMPKRVVFLHTVLSVASQFADLACELLPPDVETWHVADEILAKVVVAQGRLSPFIYRRVADHYRAAEEAGATVVQLTCSSISPCAGLVAAQVSIPVLRVDEPMIEEALALGRRIGVVATAPTALGPTVDLLNARALDAGWQVEVEVVMCREAYASLVSGDLERHDRIVRETLAELSSRNDAILLAQASMARAAEGMPLAGRIPVLTSPRLAVQRLARMIGAPE